MARYSSHSVFKLMPGRSHLPGLRPPSRAVRVIACAGSHSAIGEQLLFLPSLVTSGSAGTKSLNRDRRDHVNHHLAADQLLPSHTVVDSVRPGMSSYQYTQTVPV